jgi:hypothetical protein
VAELHLHLVRGFGPAPAAAHVRTLFAVMRAERIAAACTFDRHFRTAGFTVMG